MTGQAAPLLPDRLLEDLHAAVRTPPADQLELAVLARAGEYTRFAGDVVHQPQDITEVQYLVRAVIRGHGYRTSTTCGHRLAAAVAAAGAGARAAARAAGRSGSTVLPDVARAGGEVPDLPLWFDDVERFDAANRVALARQAMATATAAGGIAAGMLGRAVTQQAVVTSAGVHRHGVATEAGGSLTVAVRDSTSHWVDVGRSLDRLAAAHRIDAAVDQAVAGGGRTELPAGTYPVVLGPEAVAELLQFLPAIGFAGDLAADRLGVCVTAGGQQIASPLVDVADDAAADAGLPFGFDIEGVARRKVDMLVAGRVGEPVTDSATAGRLGGRSTGHAHIAREQVPAPEAANIVMDAGPYSEAELVAGLERGVYIQRFWYTRLVDRGATTITGVTRDACFLIEGGRLTRPLAGMRFTESVRTALAGVDAVGRDRRSLPVMNVWNGATTAPAVRCAAFRLGAAPADLKNGAR